MAAVTDRVPTLSERLTSAFYAWERRGRGYELWDKSVNLEPPFRPFFGHFAESVPVQDDGRRPSFWETFWRGSQASVPPEPQPESVPIHEPGARVAGSSKYHDLVLSVPEGEKIDRDAVHGFLVSLAGCRFPVSFELFGTASDIRPIVACAAEDRFTVQNQLQGFFPDVGIEESKDLVLATWRWVRDESEHQSTVIELGLAREFVYSLRSFRDLDPDPLIGFTAALEDLEEGEVGIFQVLFTPTREPWPEHALRAVSDGAGGCFFADAPEMLGEARKKLERPLFAAAVRVAARADSENRSSEIAWHLASALDQFSSPLGNGFLPLDHPLPYRREADLLLRTSGRSGMLLSLDELSSLVHPPSQSVRSTKLLRVRKRTKAAPPNAVGHRLVLGENVHRGSRFQVSVSQDNRMRHTHLIGASGTGKSTLLLSVILQDIEAGRGLAVLDPHGDLVDETLRRIPEERLDDVVLLDPSDEEFPVALNILAAHSELEKILLSSDLVGVFRRLSTSWGDQMNSVLANAIQAFLESTRGGTLMDLRTFLLDDDFRDEFLRSVTDEDVVEYWRRAFPKLSGKPQGPILTRLDTFLRPKPVRYMVRQKVTRIDFRKVMDDGMIFLGKLSAGAIGEENAALLGSLLVSKFQQVAMSRQDIKAHERRDFCLFIDEFHHFITPSLCGLLSGARKYRLGLVLAHQELKQLSAKDPEVFSAVLANPATRICFRVSDFDAKALQDGFTSFDATDLQSLGVGEAIARLERAEYDFNLETRPLPQIEAEEGEKRRLEAIERSREKYARPRAEIDAEIREARAAESAEEVADERPRRQRRPVERALSTKAASHIEAREEAGEVVPAPPRPASPPETPTVAPMPTSTLAVGAAPEPTVRPASERAKPEKPAPELPGKGGHQHRYLQELLRAWGEKQGLRVTVEKAVLDGSGSIDVALDRGEEQLLACEISCTTSVEHEIGNLQKCLAAGYAQVALISMNKRALKRASELAAELLVSADRARVRFVTPEELFSSVEEAPLPPPTEEMVSGYKVKRSFGKLESGEAESRARAISEVLAKRLSKRS